MARRALPLARCRWVELPASLRGINMWGGSGRRFAETIAGLVDRDRSAAVVCPGF